MKRRLHARMLGHDVRVRGGGDLAPTSEEMDALYERLEEQGRLGPTKSIRA